METTFILDTARIRKLLDAINRNAAWLAKNSGVGRQYVHYDLKTGCAKRVKAYAKVFNMDAKDLIK